MPSPMLPCREVIATKSAFYYAAVPLRIQHCKPLGNMDKPIISTNHHYIRHFPESTYVETLTLALLGVQIVIKK